MTTEERLKTIYERCVDVGGCLEWQGSKTHAGYPRIYHYNRMWTGGRLIWHLKVGQIPPNRFVLHKCDNPKCLNLEHLWLGTLQDNTDDMIKKGRAKFNTKKTHCPRGHLMAGENLRVRFVSGEERRICIECSRYLSRTRFRKRKPTAKRIYDESEFES